MRTPAAAMLWECWRLTRWGMAVYISIAVFLIGGLYANFLNGQAYPYELRTSGQRDPASMISIVALVAMFSVFSVVSKLTGKRRGITFSLGYARPVPTWSLVGIPMAYVCVWSVAAYLIPVIFVNAVFGAHYSVAAFAASIATIAILLTASVLLTHNEAMKWAGQSVAVFAGFVLMGIGFWFERRSDLFVFSFANYGALALVAAAAIAVAIWSVGRQRRGDDRVSFRRSAGATVSDSRVAGWLMDLFRVPCPASSPTLVQLWFEMKCVGVPVLTVGVAIALGIPAIRYVTDDYTWQGVIEVIEIYSFLFPLLAGFAWTFRGQGKRGNATMSAFDATRALGTAHLAGLKVLVTVACVLGAWLAMRTSLWASLALFEDVTEIAKPATEATRGAFSAFRLAAGVAVGLILLSTAVACFAAIRVLSLLYAKRFLAVVLSISLYLFVFVTFAMVGEGVDASFMEAHVWIVVVLIPMGTVYVFREALAIRILTPRHTGAAILLWVGFAAAYFTILRESGLLQSETAPALIALMVSSSLLPLAAVALAPWSLGLMRHR